MPAPVLIASATVTGTVTSRAMTVATASAAGDTLLVLVTNNSNSGSATACTDSKGNVYTLDASQGTSPQTYMFRSPGATGGSGGGATAALTTTDTITVTTSSTSAVYVLQGAKLTGAGAFDKAVTPVHLGTAALTNSVSGTPAADNELAIIAYTGQSAGGAPTFTAPTGAAAADAYAGTGNETSLGWVQLGTGTGGVAQTFTVTVGTAATQSLGVWLFQSPTSAVAEADRAGAADALAITAKTLPLADRAAAVDMADYALPVLCGTRLGPADTTTARTFSPSQATNAGDTLLIAAEANASPLTISSITDTQGNTWVQDFYWNSTNTPIIYGWRCDGATGGPGGGPSAALGISDVITLTVVVGGGNTIVYASLFDVPSWYGPLDKSVAVVGATGPTGASTATAPTADGELMVAVAEFSCSATGFCEINAPMHPLMVVTEQPGTHSPYLLVSAQALGPGTAGVNQQATSNQNPGAYRLGAWFFSPTPQVPVAQADAAAAAEQLAVAGAPYILGQAASSGNVASLAVPITAALTPGDGVLVCVGSGSATAVVSTVTDTKLNAYTVDVASHVIRPACFAYTGASPTPLTTSDSITVTPAVTQTIRVTVLGIPKMAAVDQHPAGAGSSSSSTFSLATGALSAPGEICVGAVNFAGSNLPTGLSWTLIQNESTAPVLTTAYILPGASTASQTFSGSVSAAAANDGGVITFTTGVPPTVVAQADAAAAADQQGVAAAVPLPEQAGAAEQLAASAAVPVPDRAAAVEALSVVVGQTVALADQAGAAEQEGISAAVPVAERAAAVEAATQAVTLALAEHAAAADAEAVSGAQPVAQADQAAAAEALSVSIAPYQAATGLTTGAGSSRTAAVSTPTGAGDTLLVLITTQNTSCTISALTDSKGNVYTQDTAAQVAVPMSYWFRSPGATGGPGGGPTAALGTSDTLTATSAASTGNVEILLIDVPGVGAVDIISSIGNGSSTAPARGFTPRADSEMCVALLANANAGGAPAITAPFSLVTTYHSGVNPYNSAAFDQLGTGTNGVAQNFAATITSAQWYVVVYTFPLAAPLTVITPADAGGATDVLAVPAQTLVPADAAAGADALAVPAQAMPVPEQAAGADQVAVTAAVTLADAAAAAEATVVAANLAVTDAAAAADSRSANATAQLAEAGASAEASVASASVPLPEQAAGADALPLPAEVLGLPETAGGADTLAVAQGSNTLLGDQAGAAEQLAVTVAAALPDTAAGADQQGVSAAVPVGERAAAADGISAQLTAVAAPLPELAAAAEQLAVTVTVALVDSAAAADTPAVSAATPLAEAGTALDALNTPARTLPLPDAGAAADGLALGAPVGLGDSAAATDASTVTVAAPAGDAGAAADLLAPTATVSLTDQGSAADAISPVVGEAVAFAEQAGAGEQLAAGVSSPAGDQAAAADALTAVVASGATDQAGAADTLSVVVGAAVTLADQPGATDLLAVAATVPAAEQAGATDAATAAVTAPAGDQAGAADSLTVVVGAQVAYPDAGSGVANLGVGVASQAADMGAVAETLVPAASTGVPDLAGAADGIAVTVGEAVALADSAAAADAEGVSAQLGLADAGTAAEALTEAISAQPHLPDTGAVTEALSASAVTGSQDRAAASDSLVVQAALDTFSGDQAAAVDDFAAVPAALVPSPTWTAGPGVLAWRATPGPARWSATAAGARWHAEPAEPAAEPGAGEPAWHPNGDSPAWRAGSGGTALLARPALRTWTVAPAASRWQAVSSPPRWAAVLAQAQWRVIMAAFKPIAAVSQQMINVKWDSDLGGEVDDPTVAPYPVRFAVPLSSMNEQAPAEPVTWFDAVWLPPTGRYKGFIAQCSVGPASSGGLVPLQAGQTYDVWSEVDTATETVRAFVGQQPVY